MGSQRLRCFLAFPLDQKVIDRLSAEVGFLQLAGADVKWVPAENRHLTLRFLGELDSEAIMPVVEATQEVLNEIPACRPVISRMITYPALDSGQPPRVIAASVDGEREPLTTAYNELQTALAEVGIRRENRGYQPHVTLGRVRANRNVEELVERMERAKRREFGVTNIRKLQLLLSTRGPKGPEYTVMNEFQLLG